MGETTKIQWAHHTFNPWRGCTKISAGCAHCYAEVQAGRNPKVLGVWGPSGSRPIAAEAYWRQPLAWNAAAQKAGERHRVFCMSLGDFFEGPETMPQTAIKPVWKARRRVVDVINQTPWLDWLLLTKRPENIMPALMDAMADEEFGRATCMAKLWLEHHPNVWIGTSVEDQLSMERRTERLLQVPAHVRFLSIEPLLGPLSQSLFFDFIKRGQFRSMAQTQFAVQDHARLKPWHAIDWVIVGGESGHNARPCNVEWIRGIVQQCQAASVPVFVKQLGAKPEYMDDGGYDEDGNEFMCNERPFSMNLRDPKGGDMDEWPEDLRVRQLPEVKA